jgi:hypothetical protein
MATPFAGDSPATPATGQEVTAIEGIYETHGMPMLEGPKACLRHPSLSPCDPVDPGLPRAPERRTIGFQEPVSAGSRFDCGVFGP